MEVLKTWDDSDEQYIEDKDRDIEERIVVRYLLLKSKVRATMKSVCYQTEFKDVEFFKSKSV